MVNVCAFATSPRRHGNSETLLDWLLASMKDHPGVAVEKIALDEITINPCRGCNACEKLGHCIQEDDLPWVLEKIIAADCIVLASPIFCMGLCAQAKALVDRTQVFRSRKYVLKIPVVPPEQKGKRLGVFLSTAGQRWDIVFDGAIPSVKCFFHLSEVKDQDIYYLLVDGVDEKGAIESHPTARSDAAALGAELVGRFSAMTGGGPA
ncbi:MAG: flavodoxin family protein [Methanomicrobiales archaeon]|nr:flavodoxin family protein [Methanomicrobiales archaeon]